jgi:RNA polymerase sigma factor FliA
MSQFDAAPDFFPTVTPSPSYPSYLPSSEQPSSPSVGSRAPQASKLAPRSARRPSTHPATTVPARAPRLRKGKKVSLSPEELLAIYTPIVNKIVGGFQRKLPRNVLREDLLAAGMIGLWDAIQRHGAECDDGFEWYVRVRVRGAILDELRAQDWLPRRLRAAAAANSATTSAPSVVRLEDVSEFEQNRCLSEQPSGESQLCARSEQESLQLAVDQLPARERHIVREHYYKEVKFKDLSVELGVSEPRVSQLHTRAMQRLRDLIGAEAEG